MLLGDLGAEVIKIERQQAARNIDKNEFKFIKCHANRRSMTLDLKSPAAVEAVLKLTDGADVLIEGYRPGVAERLGIGPDVCLARNPRLVYGRSDCLGPGRSARSAQEYIALSGALHAIVDYKRKLELVFLTRTRDEWAQTFAEEDACVMPVLEMAEVPRHPHNRARGTFVEFEGSRQPAPAPRFSRTPGNLRTSPTPPGADGEAILREMGYSTDEIRALLAVAV